MNSCSPIHWTSDAALILLKTILVATDVSEASDAALAYGRELASRSARSSSSCT